MSPHALPLTAEERQQAVEREATHSPSPVSTPPTHPRSSKEVTTMAQRILRALRRRIRTGIDADRIDAHRDAVQRELVLSRPIL